MKGQDFWDAKPDPVAKFSGPVCSHMNKDHAASTVAMVKAVVGLTVDAAEMLRLDRLGIDVEVTRKGETFRVRLPFESPADNRKAIKEQIVAMTKTVATAPEA